MTERSPRAAVAELTDSCRLASEQPVRRLALARPPRRSLEASGVIVPQGIDHAYICIPGLLASSYG